MGFIRKKNELWFFEELFSDITYGFKVSEVIVPETYTGFQKIMILETDRLGKVLLLDRIVQLTEEDEGIYHEWVAHWPLFSLSKPAKHVLIIGGGDGGVAREVLKHKYIKTVTMVEIDKMVVNLCRKHLSAISEGVFNDPRFKLIIGDGAEVIRSTKRKYDVIIIDSTDPIGPAKSLFNTDFYNNVYDALIDGGIAIHQTGALILQPFECPGSWRQMERIFDDVQVIQIANVSYMGGPFSLTAGSKGKGVFKKTLPNIKKAYKKSGIKTNWYSPQIDAFPYPEFQRRLELDKYGEEVIMDIKLPGNKLPKLNRIEKWSKQLSDAIKMKVFGAPIVSGSKLKEGDSLVRYIETSSINYRHYGNTACANCFTCAHLPVDKAIKFSIDYFGAESAVCWHLPRGSFCDVKKTRKNTKIYKAELSGSKNKDLVIASRIYKPKLIESPEVFSPRFKLPIKKGFSSAFELIIDLYDCDFSKISSSEGVAKWAGDKFWKDIGLKLIGKAEAPNFGHAKKKTAGPSVTQLFKNGSNISHYSMNWLMIVLNIVSQNEFSIKKAIKYSMKYFKSKYAVVWILPRGISSSRIKDIANNTFIFSVTESS